MYPVNEKSWVNHLCSGVQWLVTRLRSEEARRRARSCSIAVRLPNSSDSISWVALLLLDCHLLEASQDVFILGMMCAADTAAGELVLQLKESRPYIKLICVLPHPGFDEGWSAEWKARCGEVLKSADEVHVVSPEYTGDCYAMSYDRMIRRSSSMLAVVEDKGYVEGQGILSARSKKLACLGSGNIGIK